MTPSGAEAIERLALDTSAYSHLRRQHPDVERMVATAAAILVPVIVVGELEAAFATGDRRTANQERLEQFLAMPFVSVVPVTRSIGARYGDIVGRLRRAGTPIPTNDIWVAATALDEDADLVTFDTDFGRVPDLRAAILPAGERPPARS